MQAHGGGYFATILPCDGTFGGLFWCGATLGDGAENFASAKDFAKARATRDDSAGWPIYFLGARPAAYFFDVQCTVRAGNFRRSPAH